MNNEQAYIYKEFSEIHTKLGPKYCWFNRWEFSLFFTNGIVAQKSEFWDDPLISTPLLLGWLFSSIWLINAFQIEQDLKRKLFWEIDKSILGGCSKNLAFLWLWPTNDHIQKGACVLRILKVFTKHYASFS